MLDPVELNLFPSCYDCLSWSSDGDLAVALGEHVHVLIPQTKPQTPHSQGTTVGTPLASSTSKSQWTVTKFQANVFANREWPMLLPQNSAAFSLGEEQSSSHVIALSWSPHSIAKYSRHVLAVLTSNLVLSLWELTDGRSKWMRTLVVNSVLKGFFTLSFGEDFQTVQRKQHVRSFCWSPPCHEGDKDDEHRAQMSLLAVANDMDDITMIRIRNDRRPDAQRMLSAEVVSHHGLPPPSTTYPQLGPNSMLGQSMRSMHIISHITWGKWCGALNEQGNHRHTSPLAIVHGTEVRVFLLDARVEEAADEDGVPNRPLNLQLSDAIAVSQEEQFRHRGFHGPLHWIDHKGPGDESLYSLAAAYLGGYAVITFEGLLSQKPGDREQPTSAISLYHALRQDAVEGSNTLEWEPITAMTSTTDTQTHFPTLHVVHLSSSLRSLPFAPTTTESHPDNPQSADLHRQIEGFRSRFDLDHDLGSMSTARTWGMASHRGWLAASFTLHPSDMVEYITPAREHSRIVFAPPQPHLPEENQMELELDLELDTTPQLPWNIAPPLTPPLTKAARANVLDFILRESHRDLPDDPWAHKLRYAAVCCVIIDHVPADPPHLLEAAQSTAQWLSTAFNLDLSVELACIDERIHSAAQPTPTRPIIPAKSRDGNDAQKKGRDFFEFCDICGAGVDWYSAEESQCAEGHVFARCGLTLLSIQDPSVSKSCTGCGVEVLDVELVEAPPAAGLIEPAMEAGDGGEGQVQSMAGGKGLLDVLCERFDRCIYCGGRFGQ
ncbi:hypothetical protein AJ79_02591 [Helicocarpus griseus UAMH5409]|uniref:Transcription factor IIIC 90kDa subunit N-terminal domain-containing protein n=1 Tax=Helicocarpus griseus UAMH5409 TaxID=1447875 RepID=A0A2B7Y186_9EURO|nr:hypothetical protein AJ79_02591 [Helicocarpus griseus UAMH5409]